MVDLDVSKIVILCSIKRCFLAIITFRQRITLFHKTILQMIAKPAGNIHYASSLPNDNVDYRFVNRNSPTVIQYVQQCFITHRSPMCTIA